MKVFDDPVHQEFAEWALGLAPYGGADIGDIDLAASEVTPGDDSSFFEAFHAVAVARIAEGDAARDAGHRATARDCYLRAALFLGVAYHPLYGTPVDPRLADAMHLQMDTFANYMGLLDRPGEALTIAFEDTHLPGWFVRAPGHEDERRPVVLVGGGWDSTMVENHLGMGLAALDRGYHVLLHDGPGQGTVLVDQGLPLRHDWEKVVTAVVDAALAIDVVDPDGIVYQPWSLGGYMAARAAAHEHRLAAAVGDPGQMYLPMKAGVTMMGLDEAAAAGLPHLDPADAATCMAIIDGIRNLHWMFVQRGFWTNGATDLESWLVEMDKWQLDAETVGQIRCPFLVTSAEGDRGSTTADELFAAITAPKARMVFGADSGAAQHCEMLNRSMANRRILDWIDDTLHAAGVLPRS